MNRRRATVWFLSVPLMVAGSQVAHWLAYWLVYPEAQLRWRALLASGHSYMNFGVPGIGGYIPLVLGFSFALELVACGWTVAASAFGRRHAPVPPWAFALLPLLGFSFQEFIERWLAGASSPWLMVMQPTFRIGLLLQLPFALVAFLLARLLLRVAERAGRVLSDRRAVPAMVARGSVGLWLPVCVFPPRVPALAGGHAERGPPL